MIQWLILMSKIFADYSIIISLDLTRLFQTNPHYPIVQDFPDVARAARGRARLAAIATRRMQPTLGPPGAKPAVCRGGGGSRVARAARGRARLAAIATRRVRPTLGPPGAKPLWW